MLVLRVTVLPSEYSNGQGVICILFPIQNLLLAYRFEFSLIEVLFIQAIPHPFLGVHINALGAD